MLHFQNYCYIGHVLFFFVCQQSVAIFCLLIIAFLCTYSYYSTCIPKKPPVIILYSGNPESSCESILYNKARFLILKAMKILVERFNSKQGSQTQRYETRLFTYCLSLSLCNYYSMIDSLAMGDGVHRLPTGTRYRYR